MVTEEKTGCLATEFRPSVVYAINSNGKHISPPIDASYYKGQGMREGIEREYVVFRRVSDEEDRE